MVTIVVANLYVVLFGMSWGPVVWVLLGEMFDNRIRAYALAVAAAAQWVANFAASQTFPAMASASPTASMPPSGSGQETGRSPTCRMIVAAS